MVMSAKGLMGRCSAAKKGELQQRLADVLYTVFEQALGGGQVELAEACLTSAKQLELLDMVQKMLAKPGGAPQKSRGGKEPESLWYAGRVFLRRDHTSD